MKTVLISNEYSADSARMKSYIGSNSSLEESITKVLQRMYRIKDTIDAASLDSRWQTLDYKQITGG